MNKGSLQISLKKNPKNTSYIFILNVNFENLTIGLYVLYVLNTCIKFCSNQILFTIQLINLFFTHNFRSQNLEILTFVSWQSKWSLIVQKIFTRLPQIYQKDDHRLGAITNNYYHKNNFTQGRKFSVKRKTQASGYTGIFFIFECLLDYKKRSYNAKSTEWTSHHFQSNYRKVCHM